MRSTTPHIGAEPSVGPKTVVVGFPRVVVECLLALTVFSNGVVITVLDFRPRSVIDYLYLKIQPNDFVWT